MDKKGSYIPITDTRNATNKVSSHLDEVYLGDGLYVSHDGSHVVLRAPREGGNERVYLEDSVLGSFLLWLKQQELMPKGEE